MPIHVMEIDGVTQPPAPKPAQRAVAAAEKEFLNALLKTVPKGPWTGSCELGTDDLGLRLGGRVIKVRWSSFDE